MTEPVKKNKTTKDKNLHNSFYSTIIAGRVNRELEKRELEFAAAHAKDTDPELILYVCQQALKLGHSPREKEITGWQYLSDRFENWERVLLKAHLKPYPVDEPEYNYAIVEEEFDRQIALHKERKRQRKIKAAQRLKHQEEKRRAQELWLAEHPELSKKKKKKKKNSNHSSKEKPV